MFNKIIHQCWVFYCARSVSDPFNVKVLNSFPDAFGTCCLTGMCIRMKTHISGFFVQSRKGFWWELVFRTTDTYTTDILATISFCLHKCA